MGLKYGTALNIIHSYGTHNMKFVQKIFKKFWKILTKVAIIKTNWLNGLPSHKIRRELLGLQILKERRICTSLILAYHIVNGPIVWTELAYLISFYAPSRVLRQPRLFSNLITSHSIERRNYNFIPTGASDPLSRYVKIN